MCSFFAINCGSGAIETDANKGANRRQFRCRDMAANSDTLSPVARAIKNKVLRNRLRDETMAELNRRDLSKAKTRSRDHWDQVVMGAVGCGSKI